jgi:diguanylate cyclase
VERLAQRVCDDASVRSDLAESLMQGRWDELQHAIERSADGAAAQAQAWAALVDKLVRGVERGGRQWTSARKKDSLQRVLGGSGSDMQRLQHRLKQLLQSWDQDNGIDKIDSMLGDLPDGPSAAAEASAPATPAAPGTAATTETPATRETPDASVAPEAPEPPLARDTPEAQGWPPLVASLHGTVRAALPGDDARAVELADELAVLAGRIASEGASAALADAVEAACQRARRLLAHRHHLLDELSSLCRQLTAGLADLAEDDSWAQGQMQAIEARLDGGFNARSVKAASELLAHTRAQQQQLRGERDRARDALKNLIHSLLAQVGELGDQTGRYGDRLGRFGQALQQVDSSDQLDTLVREMIDDSREVQVRVQQTQQSLSDEHARAGELESRVRDLEGELRRLSQEVSTDALTQIANRRGLMQAFDAEQARLERSGGDLAVGLLDIDNFKKLNDSLGHAAGDVALKALAARVQDSLRPVDIVARFGGEEFVVLLPGTPREEAQQVLTRLQRRLSASLFMHDGREVFVTFSAGVTAYCLGETLEVALERADEALYEAKRSGKNRTCVA